MLKLSDKIECGVVLAGQSRETVLSAARAIEEAGFDSLWVGDHISFHIPLIESLTLLSFAAAVTERIQLGTAVYLVPLRNPTTSAKVVSSLDVLSGGRLRLGVGVGGEFPPEFEASGIPLAERGPRTDESIEIMRRLWSEDGVVHEGKHFSFGPVSVNPKPLQPGGPPIIVGGRKARSMRRAGELGDGYISHMCAADTYRANMESIQRHADKAGRGDSDFTAMAFMFTVFDDDYDAAHARASKMLGTIYNRPFEDAARKYCLLGRPDDCLEQMENFARSGCRHFVLSPLSDPEESVQIARESILPRLRQITV